MATINDVNIGSTHGVSNATKSRAEGFKEKGNLALKEFKLNTAVEMYTTAISLFPTAIYYANRAAAHIKTESYGLAIADSTSAIDLDSSYIKGKQCSYIEVFSSYDSFTFAFPPQ